MSPASRDALVKRYLALQDEMRKLAPGTKTPHITADMSDDEIIRLGKLLAERVEAEKEKRNDAV
jgi:hypothetical protein